MRHRRWSLLFTLVVGAAAPVFGAPNPPVITEPSRDGQIVNPADVHMEAPDSYYVDPDGSPHYSTDWEIWDSNRGERAWYRLGVYDPVLRVHIHLGDGTFDNSYAGHTQLNYDTSYVLKARVWNANGAASLWSQRTFRTSPQGPPGVPGPMPWVVLQPGFTVEIVATGFQLPVNVAFVPNAGPNPTDPFLYVVELYGAIKVMLRNGTVADYATNLLNFNPTGLFPGSGEQGVAGIVIEPATGDLFVSMLYEDSSSTADPKPHYAEVVRLHSTDGGHTAASQTTILDTAPESFGPSHQISNLTIGPDDKLYVHTGDDMLTDQDVDSFRGKILRANLDGTPCADNPFYDGPPFTARDYIYALGMRNPFGGAWRAADGAHYQVENGPDHYDRIAKVVAGRDFGWDGSDTSMLNFALYNWDPPHAPVNMAFIQPSTFSGSGFPFAKMDHAFVTESGPTWALGPQALGKRIVEFVFDKASETLVSGPTTLVEYNGIGRATAVGLAAGPDGLYFTDLYKDEDTDPPNPIAPGANLLRISYNATPQADLAITRLEGPASARPGAPVEYTIEAANLGPSPVSGATVTAAAPAGLVGATWTCAATGGGTCAASGSGRISDTVDLPMGARVTYTLSGAVGFSATHLGIAAAITAPAKVLDPNPANNTAMLRRPDRLPAQPSGPGPATGSPVARPAERAPAPVEEARSRRAWSTVGARQTSYAFTNTTRAPVTGTLTLLDGTGVVLSVLAMTIPPHEVVDVDTAALGIDRDQTGTWKFTHDGRPGAVRAESRIAPPSASPPPPPESPPSP